MKIYIFFFLFTLFIPLAFGQGLGVSPTSISFEEVQESKQLMLFNPGHDILTFNLKAPEGINITYQENYLLPRDSLPLRLTLNKELPSEVTLYIYTFSEDIINGIRIPIRHDEPVYSYEIKSIKKEKASRPVNDPTGILIVFLIPVLGLALYATFLYIKGDILS